MNSNVRTPSSPDALQTNKKNRSLRDRIHNNFLQKLIALVGSLTLFVIVSGDRNKTLEFEEIPVEISVPDGYMAMQGNTQTTIKLSLSGRASQLRDIRRADIGEIRLQAPAKEGNVQLTLQPSLLNLPEGIQVDHFKPEFIAVNLEPIEERTVDISTDHIFTGALLPGFQLGEIKLKPAQVQISGPRSTIHETSQLYIEPIDLTGKASTFTVNRWVILNRFGLKTSSAQVEVTVHIVSTSRQHVVLGVPIIALNMAQNYEFIPATIDLTLVGDEQALAKIDASKLFVTVDAERDNLPNNHTRLLKNSDFSVPNLPEGVGYNEDKLPSVLFKVWPNPTDLNETTFAPAAQSKP